jgi:hypothetical protein
MDKKQYGFGVILLLVEAIIIIQMATMAGYHSHAKATDNVGSNNAELRKGYHAEENIFRKKHPGKLIEICAKLTKNQKWDQERNTIKILPSYDKPHMESGF